jgi:pyruvate dehydrogenase E2 component (dihydrolipoamide acetyltransferase)
MLHDVVMPQLGMTMTEGSVLHWLKKSGDPIEKSEPLFEVQTDKVDMEVESPAAGFVSEILLEPEKMVPVGTVIARIADTAGEAQAEAASPAAMPAAMARAPEAGAGPGAAGAPANTPASPAPPPAEGRTLVSPRARRVAAELGIDLARVTPAGTRIVETDVRRYAGELAQLAEPTSAMGVPAAETPSAARRLTAERMTLSFQTVPHFYLSVEASAAALTRLRQELLPLIEQHCGVRLSYTDLLVKALALALKRHPGLNAGWQDGRIVRQPGIHIGIAAQFPDKLMVPVIRDADRLPLADLARARHDLVTRGRAGKLTPADLEGATCTLSNLGAYRVDRFHAIINPPQSAILAVGAIAPRPRVEGGAVVASDTVNLTLSVDHRVVDGAAGAAFLQSIVEAIEVPTRLMLGI